MIRWDEEDPGAGVMRGPTGFAAVLRGHEDVLAQVESGIGGVQDALGPKVWTGEAANAWQYEAGHTRTRQRELSELARPVHAALDEYADAVVSLRAQVSFHRQAREDAERMRYAVGGFDGSTSPAVEARRAMLAEQAEMDAHVAGAALRDLAVQRQALDDRLVGALAIPGATGWAQRKEVLSRAGITGVEALDTAKLVAAYKRFTDQALDGDLKTGDVTYLQDFFTVWGKDPAVMDAYFRSLGGERTRELVNTLGTSITDADHSVDPQSLHGLATALRHGLSSASHTWDVTTASTFAAEMFSGATGTIGGGLSVIGWLFHDRDRASMSATFATAMADQIDAVERSPGRPGELGLLDTSVVAGGRSLMWFESDSTDAMPSDRPAEQVFATLALYPEATLAWFGHSGPDEVAQGRSLGEGRVRYWFGERDWSESSTGDGFETPATLWTALQSVPGAPASGTYDPEVWTTAEIVSGGIIRELSGNPRFITDQVSDDAAIRMVASLAVEIPMLTEWAIVRGGDEIETVVDDRLPWMGEDRAVAAVSRTTLTDFAGTLGQHQTAGWYLTQAVDHYQQSLIRVAASAPGSFIQDGVEVLDGDGVFARVVGLQALVDGATHGVDITSAAAIDARHQKLVEWPVAVIEEAVPIPGTDKILGKGVGWVADLALGELVSAGVEQGNKRAEVLWAGNEKQAVIESDAECMDRADEMKYLSARIVFQVAPEKFATEQGAIEAYDQQAQKYLDVYSSARDMTDGSAGDAVCTQ
ncbi:hypothetical protein [Oerskovia rustica]|uniref:WXG100 family type VII secretion target n=1 Tax=Oerskovia rustica TaxID=2762237 RepID=A0ABR8RNW3_9CELL|nr:hypothetical protein [Oerskovia rustica]MBD7949460.1 hypothetical protein [Oerskovia rustica]